jgi:hypothetical protein
MKTSRDEGEKMQGRDVQTMRYFKTPTATRYSSRARTLVLNSRLRSLKGSSIPLLGNQPGATIKQSIEPNLKC